jgi:ATP-dependent DNA helicase RecG
MLFFKAEMPDIPTSEMSEMSEIILKTIKNDPETTTAKIAQKINFTARTVEREIKKLKESGKLKRIGPSRGKGGYWEII